MFLPVVLFSTVICLVTSVCEYKRSNKGLTRLPADIPHDVTFIKLRQNNLTKINYIPVFPKLNNIRLDHNKLREFPNVDNVANTLLSIGVGYNQIKEIPSRRILSLVHLVKLNVQGNPLVSLPNFGLLPRLPGLVVHLDQTENFYCDWRMAAVKEAETVGEDNV